MSPPESPANGKPPMCGNRQASTSSSRPVASTTTLSSPPHSPRSPPTWADQRTKSVSGSPAAELEHPLIGVGLLDSTQAPAGSRLHHNRAVSWEASGAPMTTVVQQDEVEDEDVSFISNPDLGSQPKQFETLSDPLMNPLESEADAAIQRALDDVDPTKAGPSDAQESILGFVPVETEPETFSVETSSKISKPSLKRAVTYTQGAKKLDAAESLFQLAEDLSMLNQQHGVSLAHESLDSGRAGDMLSDQDKLMRNAATLIQRNKEEPRDVEQGASVGSESAVATSPASAIDRWKTLKITVAATSARDLSKKTDSPTLNEAGADDSESHHNDESSGTDEPGQTKSRRSSYKKNKLKSRYKEMEEWLQFNKTNVYAYLKQLILYLILPSIGVSAILFYFASNPPCGTKTECIEAQQKGQTPVNNTTNSTDGSDLADLTREIFGQASASWWILFICCRQPVTLSLALATQAFFVEFLALRTKWAVKLVGPFVTLFIVQSKGWPFILFWWGIWNFVMLYGPSRWARHWLYWQDYIDLFNEANPAGLFTSAPEYRTVLIVALAVSAAVAMKRFWVGLWFGKKTFHRYADDLAAVMKKSLLIGLVAGLAKEKEQGFEREDAKLDVGMYDPQEESKDDDGSKVSQGPSQTTQGFGLSNVSRGSAMLRHASKVSFQKIKIDKLLGAWEEPEIAAKTSAKAPIPAIIQFRQSLSYLNTAYPFSVAFGLASSRTECIASAEQIYNRLSGTEKTLRFDAIASLAVRRNGEIDEETVKALIRIFRPERDGSLGLVHFAKGIDTVYKELRLLRASVANSTKLDASFEALFNVVFYFIILCIVLSALGIDPVVIFASISGFAIGFAFMIGSACSKFFEGILLIVVRRPFDIGDRINVSDCTVDTDYTGAAGWIVLDIDLFTTTVQYCSTNEVATYANSSLASCRIINAARSPKAVVIFMMKFPLDTSYKKLKVFKGAVEEFIKARPREWRSLLALRASRVEVDLGFVEYIVVGEHREGWQQTGDVLTSKANLTSFCLELSKKMNMRYTNPSVPVDLTFTNPGAERGLAMQTSLNSRAVPFSPAPSVVNEEGQGPVANRERSNTIESVDWRAVSAMFEQKK